MRFSNASLGIPNRGRDAVSTEHKWLDKGSLFWVDVLKWII